MFELPEDACEPEFAEFLNYWRRKSPPRRLPGRQHIDPFELSAHILPNLLLFAVVREAELLRFRFRLAGTGFTPVIGAEVTGRFLDEIAPPEQVQPVIDALQAIVRTRQPYYLAGDLTRPSEDYVRVKRLGVPLATDGETVDMVLAWFLPERRPLGAGGLPQRGVMSALS